MARMNTVRTNQSGSVALTSADRTTTHMGGVGFASDPRSELFRLGVNHIANDKDSYHEKGSSRDDRHRKLAAEIAVEDPSWIAGFYKYLRSDANIRTASILGSAAAINARLTNSSAVREDEVLSSQGYRGINRHLAAELPSRADEPTEFAAYYMSKYGKLPKAVKRGLGDAAQRLWNPYSVQKYDTASHGMRFADLMNLAHFTLSDSQLAAHIINRRFGNAEDADMLPAMIRENISLRKAVANGDVEALLNPSRLRAAGMTWEDALSLAGSKVDKGKLWSALITSGMVPIFATVRNLRNFDEAGISNEAKDYVHKQLANPEIIAKSRMFPYRFLSAIEQLSSYEWHSSLETATQLATVNVPVLDGETVILVDTSSSMDSPVSSKSKMTLSGLAAFFGGAIAAKNVGNVRMYIYAGDGWGNRYNGKVTAPVQVNKGHSILALAQEMRRRTGEVGHGTMTGQAIAETVSPKTKRVIINTDGQSFAFNGGNPTFNSWGSYAKSHRDIVGPNVHLYGFDLAGYKNFDVQSGARDRSHQLGGMTDATLRWIPAVERGYDCNWPWMEN